MQGFFGVFCGICFRSNTKTMLTLPRRKGSRTISTKNQKIFFSRREFHNSRIVFAEPNDQLQKQNTFFNSKDEVKLNSAKSTIWDMFGLGQESLNSVTDTVLFNIGAEDNTDTKVDHRLTAIEKKISTGPPQRGTVRNFKIIDDKDYGGESCMHVQVMREQTVGSTEHNLSGSFLRMQGSVHMPEKIIKLNQVRV
jgi:hypothetical protein